MEEEITSEMKEKIHENVDKIFELIKRIIFDYDQSILDAKKLQAQMHLFTRRRLSKQLPRVVQSV